MTAHGVSNNIAKHHPDVIYTHYPYDEWGDTMDVPKFFYSGNLKEHTDKLIYLPPYDCDAPIDAEDKASAAMEVLIEQPAVINADEIEVSSEGLKTLYVDTLTSLSGNREYWDGKVKVRNYDDSASSIATSEKQKPDEDMQNRIGNRKVLIYRPNGAYILQYRDSAISKLRDSVKVIEDSSDAIACLLSPEEDTEELKEIDSALWKAFCGIINEVRNSGTVIYDDRHIADEMVEAANGYYGCAGNLAHRCRNAGIPVMLMGAAKS